MQHDILVDQFERFLAGNASQEFHDHLAICGDCQREVAAITEITTAFREAFRPESQAPTVLEPPPGFYHRLAGRIIEDQRSQAWGFFSPGFVFFRRVAFASLLLLACLGSFLITREASEGGTDAAAIMAQHDVSGPNSAPMDRDRLLVTLANYHE